MKLLRFAFLAICFNGCADGSPYAGLPPIAASKADSIAAPEPAPPVPGFFDKKYFNHRYDFGGIYTDHPFHEYGDRSATPGPGYICLHFLPKTSEEKAFWSSANPALRDIEKYYDDPVRKAAILRPFIDGRQEAFKILAEVISKRDIRYGGGKDEDFFLAKGAVVQYHLYDDRKKIWSLVHTSPTRLFSSDSLFQVVGLVPRANAKANSSAEEATGDMERLETLLLQRYLSAGIDARNILQPATRSKLERIIHSLWNAEDFDTETFYTRELRANGTVSAKMQGDWRMILKALDFTDELEAERETEWRTPFDRVKSLRRIYQRYDDAGYGDAWHYITRTMTDHAALYILLSPPARRDSILAELKTVRGGLR